jgi:hypothetical protein
MGTPARLLARIQQRALLFGLREDAISRLSGHRDAVRNLRRSVEKGKSRGLSNEIVVAIARVLECSPSWLQGDPDAPNPVVPTMQIKAKLDEKTELERRLREIDGEIRSIRQAAKVRVSPKKAIMR